MILCRYYRYLSAGSVQYSVPGSDTVWRTALDPATRLQYFYTGARAEGSLPTLDTHTGNTLYIVLLSCHPDCAQWGSAILLQPSVVIEA